MDRPALIPAAAAALAAVIIVIFFFAGRLRRMRAKGPMMELLTAYFRGEAALDQVARRARDVGPRYASSDAFQSLAVAAFQSAAEAKLVDKAHSLEDESQLLHLLAALRTEFGIPERYKIEGWRAGRE
jgi:hypothetical protein